MLQQSKSTFKGGTLREYLGGTGPSTDLKPKRENLEMKLQEKKCSCSSLSKLQQFLHAHRMKTTFKSKVHEQKKRVPKQDQKM